MSDSRICTDGQDKMAPDQEKMAPELTNHSDSPKAALTTGEPVADDDALFDYLLKEVGMKGRFQTRFNILFNLIYTVFISMPYVNIMLAMSVPDHWCYVPGREDTNLTLAEWKELTIPRDHEAQDKHGFHKCKMYNISVPMELSSLINNSGGTLQQVGCQYGWEYDRTWYSLTAPSQEDWVCDKSLYVSNTFAVSRAADVFGCFIFGQLGDSIGRQPIFFLTLFLLVLGRCMSAFTAPVYWLFLVASFLGSISTSASFQSPLAIGIEVSAPEKRAYLTMLQNLGWTLGISIMPLIGWASGHWVTFMLVTTLPAAPFLFARKYLPESPRWLASRGKIDKCEKVLKHMAKMNGTSIPSDTKAILKKIATRKDKFYGIASLFSSWRLAKNTILIATSWIISVLTYYTMMLNISNLSGNPFLNFFWQSMVELPGYIVGRALSDRYGRRWTQSGSFLLLSLSQAVIIFLIKDASLHWLTTGLVVFVKFWVTITFYINYLQSMEIYPTCVRQTGTALASLLSSGMGIIGPYIVYLGVSIDVTYPYIILAAMAALGVVSCTFIPETLNLQLPETLADAQTFGQDQKFWQIHYNKKKTQNTNVIL